MSSKEYTTGDNSKQYSQRLAILNDHPDSSLDIFQLNQTDSEFRSESRQRRKSDDLRWLEKALCDKDDSTVALQEQL